MLLFILQFLACSEDKSIENESTLNFLYTHQLSGKEFLKDEISALSIHQIDTLLLVYVRKMPYFYSVYNVKDLTLLGRIGVRGDGPEEWQGAFFTGQVEQKENQTYLWINERSKSQLIKLNLTKSLEEKKVIQEKTLSYKPELGFGSYIFSIDDKKWLGNQSVSESKKGRLINYNPATQVIETVKLTPIVPLLENTSIPLKYELYSEHLALKPDKRYLVSAMRYFNRIDIYDLEGNIAHSFEGKGNARNLNFKEGDLKNEDLSQLILHYQYVTVSDKYIYALYFEQEEQKYGEEMKPLEIHVFDWKAKPIAKLKIPDYLISFCVDEVSNKIYGINFFEEKNLSYDLPNIE